MEPHLFRADVLEKRSETSLKRIFRDWLYCSVIKVRCVPFGTAEKRGFEPRHGY